MNTALQPVRVSVTQLSSAVHGSDSYPVAVRRHLLDQLVRLTLMALARVALGGRTLAVDLGNGFDLVCTVQPNAPAGAAAALQGDAP